MPYLITKIPKPSEKKVGFIETDRKSQQAQSVTKLRAEFEIPGEVGNLSIDMLFGDYLLEWLEITIGRLAIAQHILLIRNSSKA